MNIKAIETEYKGKKISEIEKVADAAKDQINGGRLSFIKTLYYLKYTSRFKENTTYSKASFETYIKDRYAMRLTTFNSEMWAFFKFEDVALKRGPGIVSSVKSKCGVLKVKKVFDEIAKAESARKTPLPRAKMQEIINNHAKPVKPKPATVSKAYQQAEINRIKAENIDKDKIIKQQDAQIARLTKALEYYKAEYDALVRMTGPFVTFHNRCKSDRHKAIGV